MREEMNAQSSRKDLQVIILEEHIAAIRWEEEGREFYLDGKLYDVASIEKQNGKTMIHCVCDKDETELAKDVAKTIASSHEKANGKESKQTVKFQLSDYTVQLTDKTSYSLIAPSREYLDFDVAILSSPLSVDTDPPRA